MKNIFLFLFLISAIASSNAQSAHTYLRSADQSYNEKDFATAEEEYRKALEKKKSVNGSYNLGNAIYEQERFEEAIKHYEDAAAMAKDDAVRYKAYHNLGNAYMNTQEFDKSIESYKNALRLNPKDLETKYNLALAQKQLMQQQQQQQQQQEQSDENQEQQEQQDQEQQQQDQQQEQNQEQQEQGESKEDKEKQEQESQEASEQQQEKDLNKEEARRLLQIMEEEERKVQEKLRKAQTEPNKSDKDW